MNSHLYLSLLPESLVASMLPPEEFGAYLAAGTRKQPHGQAMFFQFKPDFRSDYFDLADVDQRCVPHADGRPKHSLYLGIHRVLEHVPLEALGSLWLITSHGRALELKQGAAPQGPFGKYHLYRELCPVHPIIASTLDPVQFSKFITDPTRSISVPRICIVDLELSGLAEDPLHGNAGDLPYQDINHVRECLAELNGLGKQTKTVDRIPQQAMLFRCIESGFYVGDQGRVMHYPYPTRQEMETTYHAWWRCANDSELEYAGWSV